MLQSLVKLDYYVFFLINGRWHNEFMDMLLPFFRNKYFWAPLYLFLITFLIVNYRRKGYIIILSLLLTVLMSDQFSSSIVKPLFQRLRPCNDTAIATYVRLLVPCGSGYSFISSHATNHFAVAIFFSFLFFQKYKWILPVGLSWAALVSYSQVYVGLHFPLDILVGGFFGIIIGLLMSFWCSRTLFLLNKKWHLNL